MFCISNFADDELFDIEQGSGVDDLLQLHEGAQQDQQQLDRALMAESGATVVSSAEAEASRKNIQEFLKHHCAYELLPESGKVCPFLSFILIAYAYISRCAQIGEVIKTSFAIIGLRANDLDRIWLFKAKGDYACLC